MSRLFSVAFGASIFVALAANDARAAESSACPASELRASADAEFSSQMQSAIVDRMKTRRWSSRAAFAQEAPVPAPKDLAAMRKEMKEIDDKARSMSPGQRDKAFDNIPAFIDKLAPKTVLEAEFLHAIQFSGKSLGWAVDWNGTVERTSDGGLTWTNIRVANPGLAQRIDPTSGIFRNMHFADEKFGLIVGLGPVFSSADGGVTWHTVPQPSYLHSLNAVFCDPAKSCWVAGDEPNAIYRRGFGQSSWSRQQSPAKGVITAIQFIGSTGWATSNRGEIIGTTDGGKHWNELFRDESKKFHALHFLDDQQGWAVGSRALIMRTQDGGKTWVDQTLPTPRGFPVDELSLDAVKFANSKQGWAAGLHGIILGTGDGGGCWTVQRWEGPVHSLTINALAITDGPTVWAAGNLGNIYVSTDGGAFWFPVHGMAVDIMREMKRAMESPEKG